MYRQIITTEQHRASMQRAVDAVIRDVLDELDDRDAISWGVDRLAEEIHRRAVPAMVAALETPMHQAGVRLVEMRIWPEVSRA
jgi:hypothetical protein